MSKLNTISLLLVVFSVTAVFSQQDSITILDEVILTDVRLLQFSNGKKIEVLKDSVIRQNGKSLTDLLQFNSSIYFKENGLGMISSPSFRGTNASQTAVLWNGININSQLTGQIDFNTLVPMNYGSVSIRSGGGSVEFGSGAVGGSIHLNDVFKFEHHLNNDIDLAYGSFNTKNLNYKFSLGSKKMVVGLGVNYMASENDYEYLGTNQVNKNGGFENANLNAYFGYHLSGNQLIKFYQNTFLGDRDFSGTLTAPSNSNYRDINSRNLLEWNLFNGKSINRIKVAYLYEKYKYFANKATSDFSTGNTNTVIVNYDYKVQYRNFTFNGIAEYNRVNAQGSAIENAVRNTGAATLLLKQKLNEKFTYGANIRKEFVDEYKSPFVFSVNASYSKNAFKSYINASKNYRIPTFNDLFWQESAGSRGNPNVMPETSWQTEIGQIFSGEKYNLEWAAYYIASNDLIQWRPGTDGIWSPVNVNETSNLGFELSGELREQWGKHHLGWKGSYAYVSAKDLEKDNFLMYVPKHKINATLTYSYDDWECYYQLYYNGKVYITTDNSESLPGYSVSNIGVGKGFTFKKDFRLKALFQINNLFNKNYQNVAYRPMPGRNINLKLIFKL